MQVNRSYAKLAAQLGDICYKLHLLQDEQQKLLQEIKKLDELAKLMKSSGSVNEANQPETEKHPEGTSSTT